MSLSLITAAEMFASSIEQVDYAIDHFEKNDMLDHLLETAKNGCVRLDCDDRDYPIFVSSRDTMLERSINHNIIWGNEDCNNSLVDAVFWIQGAIDGDLTTFVVAGAVINHSVN